MLEQLGRELYRAQHRILDHRVFINGEIEAFLNNFELKRNDEEIETLFQVTETLGALKYDLINCCVTLGTQNLKEIGNKSTEVLTAVNNILNAAKQEREPSEELIKSRLEREKRKLHFLNDLQYSYQRIDNSFEEKEEEIAELYSDLQLKLNIQN